MGIKFEKFKTILKYTTAVTAGAGGVYGGEQGLEYVNNLKQDRQLLRQEMVRNYTPAKDVFVQFDNNNAAHKEILLALRSKQDEAKKFKEGFSAGQKGIKPQPVESAAQKVKVIVTKAKTKIAQAGKSVLAKAKNIAVNPKTVVADVKKSGLRYK